MPTLRHTLVLSVAVLILVSAGGAAPPARVRVGGARGGDGYGETAPEGKAALLARINRERRQAGVAPVAYDLLGARVGDAFCLDAATRGSVGHWDTAGRAPYLRWGLAGGVDLHAQNFASETRSGFGFNEPAETILLAAHGRFMAEVPPDDGHRRTVLDPQWTHVGIGYAVVGGEMRMTEEFSRRVLEWVELPAGPLAAGSAADLTMKLPRGWSVAGVEVSREPPLRPLSLSQIRARGGYGYPPPLRTLRPSLPEGFRWADGSPGSFEVSRDGRFSVRAPLDAGPGFYFFLVYAGPGSTSGRTLTPVAAPMVEAR